MKSIKNTGSKFFVILSIFILIVVLLLLVFHLYQNEEIKNAPTKESQKNDQKVLDTEGNFVHISDIHFNPFFDPSLVEQLVNSNADQWNEIFESSEIKDFGTVGKSETNHQLLISSLKDASKTSGDSDFIIFTGDFLAHEFPKKFKTYAPAGSKYDQFVDKTIKYVGIMFNQYFPEKPVFISLGNNDCYSGDYQIIPEGDFLKNSTSIFSHYFLKNPKNQMLFESIFHYGGYYEIYPFDNKDTIIISVNSIFFSPKHKNTVDYDPAQRQLDWLEKRLRFAQQNKQKVWLLLHIPPGTNVYSTLSHQEYRSMWVKEYNNHFIHLMKTYTPIIKAGFCGHTHMDDFRILTHQPVSQQPFVFMRISPAISPEFGNNPGYQQYRYNKTGFYLNDYILFFLNLDDSQTNWQKEYRFSEVYAQPNITTASILAVYKEINNNSEIRQNYMKFYTVSASSDSSLTEDNWQSYWCGIANWTQETFENCQN